MYVHQFYLLAIWSIPHLYIYILYGLLFALLVLGIYSAVSVCMCMLVSNGSYILDCDCDAKLCSLFS